MRNRGSDDKVADEVPSSGVDPVTDRLLRLVSKPFSAVSKLFDGFPSGRG